MKQECLVLGSEEGGEGSEGSQGVHREKAERNQVQMRSISGPPEGPHQVPLNARGTQFASNHFHFRRP